MAPKCPRCTAECTCKKVKRRKPRQGRLARSKPVYAPPTPQQFFISPLPAMREKQEMTTLREIPSVRADYVDTAVAQERKEKERVGRERSAMEMEDLRSQIPRAYERGEREGTIKGREYTLTLQLPSAGGGRKSVREVLEETEGGDKVVAVRSARYRKGGREDEVIETIEAERQAMAGGGAVGGGLRRRPLVAPEAKKDE